MSHPANVIAAEFPFHITGRCINREWFKVPMPEVWKICTEQLFFIHHAYNIRIHAFVLMSNHFHLIPSAPKGNLPTAMNWFMREVSRSITRTSGRINQTWGRPYHPSLIGTDEYFLTAYRYLYRNPVEAGLVDRVEKYPYSTLPGLLGLNQFVIPTVDNILFPDVEKKLLWLNTPYGENEFDYITTGLKRKKFELPKDRSTRKIISIEINANALPK